jgi:broad specificity phosphatase PhoE
MKIILLRHEERENNVGFYSDLTDNGIKKSLLLYDNLKDLKIDIIFSSLFIRTLHTISDYCIKKEIKINIDYGLYEYMHNPYFLNEMVYTLNDIDNIELKSIINYNYVSVVNKKDFNILEDECQLKNRIIKFIEYLKENYNDKSILLVTHKGVINKIKDLYFKKTDIDDDFEMGHYEIFNL